MKTTVTNDQIATFTRRSNELYRRLMEGTLSAEAVLVGLQALVEGQSPISTALAGMIAECKFRYANPDINERNFPLTGSVADVSDMLTVSQKDLGGKDMTTAEIETAIDRKGYRSATLAEQLAYAKAKWNGKDWVVALGSSWVGPGGRRFVPFLFEDDDGRELGLRWGSPGYRWSGGCLFLVVRK